MKTVTIKLTRENARLAEIAAKVFEDSVEDYVNETLNQYLTDVVSSGRLGEVDVASRTFDSVEEARRICTKADAHDQLQRRWLATSYSKIPGRVEVQIIGNNARTTFVDETKQNGEQ